APQALFTMNSPFVIDQAVAITDSVEFQKHVSDEARVRHLFTRVLQRQPDALEIMRVSRFVESQTRFYTEPPKRASRVTSPWPLAAQALLMSNEFLYID
ncbi:MAG TPA: DUF1553 domain-containing protein, partial [Pirellulaceae bacterium]|nr:DUF1553 domain-containing protein [Pirellulaceae bacterium]